MTRCASSWPSGYARSPPCPSRTSGSCGGGPGGAGCAGPRRPPRSPRSSRRSPSASPPACRGRGGPQGAAPWPRRRPRRGPGPRAWQPAGPAPAADASPAVAPYIVIPWGGDGPPRSETFSRAGPSRLSQPPAGQYLVGAAAAGDDRTFVVQAEVGGQRQGQRTEGRPAQECHHGRLRRTSAGLRRPADIPGHGAGRPDEGCPVGLCHLPGRQHARVRQHE